MLDITLVFLHFAPLATKPKKDIKIVCYKARAWMDVLYLFIFVKKPNKSLMAEFDFPYNDFTFSYLLSLGQNLSFSM